MSDREGFDTALNLALACGVTKPLREYVEAGKRIPEETVSVGNCPSKPMRALVAELLGDGQPVQRRGRGRPSRALRVTHRPPSKAFPISQKPGRLYKPI